MTLRVRRVETEAFPVVLDREDKGSTLHAELHPADSAAGVPDGVGDGLGGDSVGGYLDRGGESWQLLRLDDDRRGRAHGQAPGELVDGSGETELVEGRRPEAVDDPADLRKRLAKITSEGFDVRGNGSAVTQLALDDVHAQYGACE